MRIGIATDHGGFNWKQSGFNGSAEQATRTINFGADR